MRGMGQTFHMLLSRAFHAQRAALCPYLIGLWAAQDFWLSESERRQQPAQVGGL